ncbi:MAG: hypothetical protein QOD42_1549 [Sphingomonadales bacterium]|jgi:hypothetical protein|nr:hypothetical protein [Sphingomonadales bacterium]
MRDRFCWHCGHTQPLHTYAGGCSFAPPPAGCDCPRYEDGEFYGQQLKRDTHTLSDRRRLGLRGRGAAQRSRPERAFAAAVPAAETTLTKRSEKVPLDKTDIIEALRKSRLDVHLSEYKVLRDEILKRLETQRQAFNYTVVVLGAVVTGLGILIGRDAGGANLALLPHLSLLLPLIVGPLAFIFFDDELVMYRDIFHISKYVRYRVAEQLKWEEGAFDGDPRLAYDVKLFMVEAYGFAWLSPASQRIHSGLSTGRWLLFLLPVAVPPFNFFFFTLLWGGRAVPGQIGGLHMRLTLLWVLALTADFIILGMLVRAIAAALKEQARWREELKPETGAPALPTAAEKIGLLQLFRPRRPAAPVPPPD